MQTIKIHCKYDKLIPIEAFVPHEKNANKHPKKQIDLLARLIKFQGVRHPIIISNLSGKCVAGHGRYDALKSLDFKQIPAVYQDFEDAHQEIAFLVSDNKIQELAETDEDVLKSLALEMPDDFDLDLLGIPDFELSIPDPDKEAIQDEVPEINFKTKSKLGDLYELGNHRLLCGDSTDKATVEKLMNGEKADMVFTDPPYGVSYEKKTQSIANQSKARHKSTIANDDLTTDDLKHIILSVFKNIDHVLADKSCYYVASPQGGELGLMMMMMMMQEANLLCRHMIIWVKNAPVFSMGRLDYDYQHEPLLFGWSKNRTHLKSKQAGQWKTSVWTLAKEPNKLHPTMKPTALIENALINSTDPNMICIDFFGGSGSTLIACEKTNRKCYMMELDPHYVDIIVSRYCKYTGQNKVKLNGKEIIWTLDDEKK